MASQTPKLFKNLKRRFVLNATILSGLVIIIAFSLIYLIVSNSLKNHRPPENDFHPTHIEAIDEEFNNIIESRIEATKQQSLQTLLITLVVTGFSLEAIIIIASLIAADASIKPVREAYEAQKTFISNASHEIKTPLAVIQANLEAADIKGNHWLDNVQQKVEDLTALNNSLLSLARMDQTKTEPAKKSNVKLAKLVRKTADFYQPKIAERKLKLEFDIDDENLSLPIVRAEFVQILNILLDNAVKYANSFIKITLNNHQLSVKNDGATITQDQLKHIFERFYQTDKSKPGVGLGLSIAKSLAERNEWDLSAHSDQTSTTFSLKLS